MSAPAPPAPAVDGEAAVQPPPLEQQQQELKRMTLEDLDRMDAEADERWRNRPRPVARVGAGGTDALEVQELRVCSLPHGGVSPAVRAKLEQSMARREAERRAKEQEAQQQQQ